MDATVVRQKLIFHALLRQLEAENVSEEALAQYLSLGGSDNLELLRELLMCFFGSKLGTPKLWMVNTKLD